MCWHYLQQSCNFSMFGWYPSVLCDEPATISIQLGFLGTATFDSIACWSSLLTGGLYRTPAYTAMHHVHACSYSE